MAKVWRRPRRSRRRARSPRRSARVEFARVRANMSRHDRRSFLIAAAAAAGTLAIPRGASAWVPPSDFLVQHMADRRKNVKTLSIKGIRTFVGRSFEGGKQDVAETMLVNAT